MNGRARRFGGWVLAACAWLIGPARAQDDSVFDRIDEALTVSLAGDRVRARLSGTAEAEAYAFSRPAPGLIDAPGTSLFNPRLVTFLDVQAGPHAYVFAQARIDRGFDPAADPATARLDEYALRLTPAADARVNVQVGKFATIVGNWVPRHGAWENPFVTAPLPYENLTGVWDVAPARSTAMLLEWSHVRPRPGSSPMDDKYLRLPIVWGPSYATGAAVFGEIGTLTYAAEVKNAALSSRPEVWSDPEPLGRHPTLSGRLGWRPNAMWNVGFSASAGPYLRESAGPALAPGLRLGDYRETVLAQDLAFAWHHVQVWVEFFEARFAIPRVGDADTFAAYAEVKYKFTPQLTGAVRANVQRFADFPDGAGGSVPWSANKWRIEVAPSYRFTPHTALKLQYGFEHDGGRKPRAAHVGAVQVVVRY